MIDPNLLRNQLNIVAENLKKRGFSVDVESLQALEERRKGFQMKLQELQNVRNSLSKSIGQTKAKGGDVTALLEEADKASQDLQALQSVAEQAVADQQTAWSYIPNLLHESVPFIANPIGWYLMGGYRVKNIMPHITYARERLTDNDARRFNSSVNNIALQTFGYTLDNLAQFFTGTSYYNFGGAGNQTSVTLGVRWDIMDGVALKAEYSHVHPDKLSQGLFVLNPLKSVNVYSFAVNAVM